MLIVAIELYIPLKLKAVFAKSIPIVVMFMRTLLFLLIDAPHLLETEEVHIIY